MGKSASPDAGFWERAAAWKAVLFIVAYLAFYLAVGQLIGRLFGGQINDDDVLADPSSIVFGIALAIAVGAIALLVFAARVGWLSAIFGPQPIRGRAWMWIAPALIVAAIVAHVIGIDWGRWSGGQIAALAFVGLCVGLAEEIATRGVAVKILRDAGHPEVFVAVGSSLLFALMHTVNIFSGMAATTVAVTVVYTFGFGMCMYLTMRVTGTIWAAIVLHALTDPTTILAAGGLDEAGAGQGGGETAMIATTLTVVLVVFALVAAFLVRGRVSPSARAEVPGA
ncbi:CAAX protease self-immunity [Nocardioides sp. YR527]|uniref:CPBP family intramembrane glutamic endopeptidase n=1 Tax=Nocardioides sp. YR527 TaxID=1881028 RepID=UPI000882B526|nr:CPBP family intramembrane glutamic endopeptidase [Nocardioides sp. YR527]SDL31217.1 CAAX protease self-immunity [Nocardioides sp. YR527]